MLLRHLLLRGRAFLVVALALAGCGGSGSTTTAPTTTQASSLPPGCSVDDVDRIVTSFLARPQLAPPSFFELYASYETDGRTFVAKKRAAALAHLRARVAAGERDRLLSLRVSPQDVNHVRITFSLTRFAPDFRARGLHTRLARGGGTIDCAHGLVAAWVMKGP